VVDASPIVLWTTTVVEPVGNDDTPGIAFDGSTFLVSWIFQGNILTIRVAGDGSADSLRTIPVVTPNNRDNWALVHSPLVAWTGSRFFLGYSIERYNCCASDGKFPPLAAIGGFDATHVSSAESLSPLFDPVGAGTVPVAMAFGAGRVTFAWYRGSYEVTIAQATADGIPLSAPYSIALGPDRYCGLITPGIGWDGTNFVLAWTAPVCDHASVRAIRLNPAGDAIDDAPFDVAVDVLGYVPPSVVPTPDGVVIVYSRMDATNDAPRAFERSLARLPPSLPRRRSVVQ
jgi:hypothetical protein